MAAQDFKPKAEAASAVLNVDEFIQKILDNRATQTAGMEKKEDVLQTAALKQAKQSLVDRYSHLVNSNEDLPPEMQAKSLEFKTVAALARKGLEFEVAALLGDSKRIVEMLNKNEVHPLCMATESISMSQAHPRLRVFVQQNSPEILSQLLQKLPSGVFTCTRPFGPTENSHRRPLVPHPFVHYLSDVCDNYKKGGKDRENAKAVLKLLVEQGSFPNDAVMQTVFQHHAVRLDEPLVGFSSSAAKRYLSRVALDPYLEQKGFSPMFTAEELLNSQEATLYDQMRHDGSGILGTYEGGRGIHWESIDSYLNDAAKKQGLDDKQKAEIRGHIDQTFAALSEPIYCLYEPTQALQWGMEPQLKTKAAVQAAQERALAEATARQGAARQQATRQQVVEQKAGRDQNAGNAASSAGNALAAAQSSQANVAQATMSGPGAANVAHQPSAQSPAPEAKRNGPSA